MIIEDITDKIDKDLNILFEGWIKLPHSYAIVLCFQLVGLYRLQRRPSYNGPRINIFVKETEYFFDKWNSLNMNLGDIYPEEHAKILEEIVSNNAEGPVKFDIIYRIAYPYNITIDNSNISVPKCIFYTSEYSIIDNTYFKAPPSIKDTEGIKKYLSMPVVAKNLFFTGPSFWSTNGLKEFGVPDNHNKTITHGIDTSIYYRNNTEREIMRKEFNFTDNDYVLLNMGAFTSNKGILELLQLINILVNKMNKKNYKIVFKGLQDLYESESMLKMYFEALKDFISEEEKNKLFNGGFIKFISKSLNFNDMRKMYNMCDLYISPYIAEGFNITPLEAIACGVPVLITGTGSTKEYVDDILNNVPECPLYRIRSNVVVQQDSKHINQIDFSDFLMQVIKISEDKNNSYDSLLSETIYQRTKAFLEREYSWERVAEMLIDYFEEIITG